MCFPLSSTIGFLLGFSSYSLKTRCILQRIPTKLLKCYFGDSGDLSFNQHGHELVGKMNKCLLFKQQWPIQIPLCFSHLQILISSTTLIPIDFFVKIPQDCSLMRMLKKSLYRETKRRGGERNFLMRKCLILILYIRILQAYEEKRRV